MISYEQALAMIRGRGEEAASKRETRVSVSSALKMALAQDVLGAEDVPQFDNSAMDGFAVNASFTRSASSDTPVSLKVSGYIAAGDALPGISRSPGTAVEIMTGAPMPGHPYDAVIRVEDVEVSSKGGDRVITIRKAAKAGDNVRPQGSDFKAGQTAARAGDWITPAHVMAFSGLGISEVTAQRRPKVAVISTGKELLALGETRREGSQIWNSSGPYLTSLLREIGCEVLDLGIVTDCPETFISQFRRALGWGAEVVLSTGAVSMGKHDFVVEAIQSIGGKLDFHKVAIRPGKPICFGTIPGSAGHTAFFGLPGNPISTAVGFGFFVQPYLRCLLKRPIDKGIPARLSQAIRKPEGLRCFFKGRASIAPGGVEVRILEGQGSYVISSLLEANCWVELPEAENCLAHGTEVRIRFLNGLEGLENG